MVKNALGWLFKSLKIVNKYTWDEKRFIIIVIINTWSINIIREKRFIIIVIISKHFMRRIIINVRAIRVRKCI